MRRALGRVLAGMCGGAVLVLAGAGPAVVVAHRQPATTAPAPAQPQSDLWSARLAALDPSKPRGYFELAEEVAGEAADPGQRGLARHLYVLAYELDRRADGAGERLRLGPSVCLGLAAVARRPEERRWLMALAQAMDDRQGAPAALAPSSAGGATVSTSGDDAAFALATAIGLARSGEGRRAEGYLERPGVGELLERYDADAAVGGGLSTSVHRAIRDWPQCPQCQNRRVVRAGTKGEVALCDTCRGNPGPAIADQELVRQLRVESALLGGVHRSWASQVIADGGAPLRDLDPSELAATYDVDPAKPLWRDGKWTGAGEAPPPASSKPEGGQTER